MKTVSVKFGKQAFVEVYYDDLSMKVTGVRLVNNTKKLLTVRFIDPWKASYDASPSLNIQNSIPVILRPTYKAVRDDLNREICADVTWIATLGGK